MSTESANEYQGTVHEYDGILEHDNRLPAWWLMTLFGAIAFGIGYWFFYHTFEVAPGLRETYAIEWKELEEKRIAKEASQPVDDTTLAARAQDAAAVAGGLATFKSTCAACHGQNAEGLVGPNLTDAAWIHGNKPLDIYKVVADGVVAKGMPPWKATLGDKATKDVVAYVLTLKGLNLPGKAPEGSVDGAPVAPAAPAPAVDAGPAAPTPTPAPTP